MLKLSKQLVGGEKVTRRDGVNCRNLELCLLSEGKHAQFLSHPAFLQNTK
jgi:hypothetical protein